MRSHRDIPPRHLLEDQAESDERHDKAQILLDLTNVDVIVFSELPLKRLDESLPLKSVQLDIKDQKLDVHHSGMIAWCQLDGVSEWELAALAALVVSKANKAIVITYIEAAMHQSAYELHTSSFAETVEGVNALQPPAIVRGLGGSLLSKVSMLMIDYNSLSLKSLESLQ